MKIFGFILFMCLFLHFSCAQEVTYVGDLDVIPASKNYWASHGDITFNSGKTGNQERSSLLYVGNVTGGSLVLYGRGNYDTGSGVVFVLIIDSFGFVTVKHKISGESLSYFGYSGAVIKRSNGSLSAIFDEDIRDNNYAVLDFDEYGNYTKSDITISIDKPGNPEVHISSFREDMIALVCEGNSFTTNGYIISTSDYTTLKNFSLGFPMKSLSYYGDMFYSNSDTNVYAFNFTLQNNIDQIFNYSLPGRTLYNLAAIDHPNIPSLLIYDLSSPNSFYWAELPISNSTLYFDSGNAYRNISESSYGFCGVAINNDVLICTSSGFSSLTIDGDIQPPEIQTTSFATTETTADTSMVYTSITGTVTYLSTVDSTISSVETTTLNSNIDTTTSNVETTTLNSNIDTTTSNVETTTLNSNIDTTTISQETTTISEEIDSTSNPCEIFGGSNCNSNSDGTDGGITIGDTDDTEPEVITIGGEGEDISIGGDISTGQINITLSGNLTIGGTLNVGGGTTIVFSKGTITAECVYFEDGSFIQVDLTAEEKKQLAENDESVVLINSECVDGEEQFTERTSDCQNGVQESYNYDNGQLSASFSTCIEPGYIILIMAIIIAVVAGFICLVFFTPLQKVIFPHRQEENKRDSIVRDERLMDRLTVLDTELKQIQKRTDDLDKEIAELESNEISSSA
eukprot:TRINITY_DN1985_c0_g1_i4.p1 TRINITY_DN1985_c0_g1~~TRINITY_DN1985_c0_g1_i4.p1  ORF type:complete len:684 (-),score=121.35 TRINITY_DN1985_c0_g1_i4:21-2072(-)